MLLYMHQGERVGYYLNALEHELFYGAEISDAPNIMKLIEQDILPIRIRDNMYQAIRRLFPIFGSKNEIENLFGDHPF